MMMKISIYVFILNQMRYYGTDR